MTKLVKVLFQIPITYRQNIILLSLCLCYRVSCELMELIARKRLLISGGAGAGSRAGGSTGGDKAVLCIYKFSYIYIHIYCIKYVYYIFSLCQYAFYLHLPHHARLPRTAPRLFFSYYQQFVFYEITNNRSLKLCTVFDVNKILKKIVFYFYYFHHSAIDFFHITLKW